VEVGAVPVFVDVDPDTLLIDPAAAADAVGRRTAAIIGVHLFGQISDLDTLRSITTRHGLALVEDAAQAHGARDLGRRAGGIGDAAAFSFYPGKNLGAFGDGGAVTTDDPALAERVRVLADHGRSRTDRHRHDVPGRNSRLDALQAAVLRVKLRRLDVDNRARSAAMAAYREQLDLFAGSVDVRAGAEPVHHLAVFRFADRDAVTARMTVNQIGWGIHYPVPCHLQPAFRTRSRLRVAEQAAQQICSLPLSPTISPEQIDRVCAVIRSVVHP
jgi:dTDP-4-amino-4,6-dideoxygalactose transaminase